MQEKDRDEVAELRRENEKLSRRLAEYEYLEEDLMAKRVFEKAKRQLTVWLTFGGIAFLILGIVGIRSIHESAQITAQSIAREYAESFVAEHAEPIFQEKITEQMVDMENRTRQLIEERTNELLRSVQRVSNKMDDRVRETVGKIEKE